MAPIGVATLGASSLWLPGLLSVCFLLMIVMLLALCADDSSSKKPNNNRKGPPEFSNMAASPASQPTPGAERATLPRPSVDASYLRQPVAIDNTPSGQMARKQPKGQLKCDAVQILKDILRDKKTFTNICISEKRITVGEIIGSGEFGLVHDGKLLDRKLANPQKVAVKTIQGEKCTRKDVELFLKEVLRMRKFNHPNVMSMKAMAIRDNKPHVILPYMHNGDLRAFIGVPSRNFSVEQLLRLGLQVAEGMKYLAREGFVHRDLAARNCMVDDRVTVMVADFGLSRDLYDGDYYVMKDISTPLPIRWMAVEAIFQQKFTEKSDVWSFGVLLWELVTRGRKPYPSIKENVEVVNFIKTGNRMKAPDYVSPPIVRLMRNCWSTQGSDRPTFEVICGLITKILVGDVDNGNYLRPAKANRKH